MSNKTPFWNEPEEGYAKMGQIGKNSVSIGDLPMNSPKFRVDP